MVIEVYLDDGRIYKYEVPSAEKAREHCSAIVNGGYRHNNGEGVFEHYPPHRILKVKAVGAPIPTRYTDESIGT